MPDYGRDLDIGYPTDKNDLKKAALALQILIDEDLEDGDYPEAGE
uniref:Uncharacterized protein n=1 Tax=viral metagenome TaxID=1070528 RepID=A0A6M3IZL0_9ZZZZ